MLNLDNTFTFTTPDESIETSEQTDQKPNEGGEDNKDNENEDEEQEFEFRLFSAPAGAGEPDPVTAATTATSNAGKQGDEENKSGTQKLRIRLRSPTPGPADLSEGRFVNPSRGWRYYFTTPVLSGSTEGENEDADPDAALKRKQFEEVAVSGQHMLGWASLQPWVSVLSFYLLFFPIDLIDLTIPSPVAISPGESSISNANIPNYPKMHYQHPHPLMSTWAIPRRRHRPSLARSRVKSAVSNCASV